MDSFINYSDRYRKISFLQLLEPYKPWRRREDAAGWWGSWPDMSVWAPHLHMGSAANRPGSQGTKSLDLKWWSLVSILQVKSPEWRKINQRRAEHPKTKVTGQTCYSWGRMTGNLKTMGLYHMGHWGGLPAGPEHTTWLGLSQWCLQGQRVDTCGQALCISIWGRRNWDIQKFHSRRALLDQQWKNQESWQP